MNASIQRARWIWRATSRPNQYVQFRRSFTWQPGGPACLSITADAEYRLWLNGRFVGQGPLPRTPELEPSCYVDSWEVGNLLETENTLAVEVYFHGRTTKWTVTSGKGGLLLALEDEAGARRLLSDADWLCREAPAWRADTPERSSVGYHVEVYDARFADDWRNRDFDGAGWEPVTCMGTPPAAPWGKLVPRGLRHYHDRSVVRPAAVVAVNEFQPGEWEFPAERFLNEEILSPGQCALGTPSPDNGLPAWVDVPPNRALSLTLDFGRMLTGWIELDCLAAVGWEIDLTYRPAYDPATGQLRYLWVPDDAPDWAIGRRNHGDRYITGEGRQQWRTWDVKCGRFVEMRLRHPDGGRFEPLSVTWRQRLIFTDEAGSVDSSDPFVAQLWQLGAQTLRVCAQDVFSDSMERERTGWIGDAASQMFYAWRAFADFGPDSLSEKSIRQILAHQLPEAPGVLWNHPPTLSAFLPGQALHFLYRCAGYFRHSNRLELLRELWPAIEPCLSFYDNARNEDGLIDVLNMDAPPLRPAGKCWCWIDHTSRLGDRHAKIAGGLLHYNALYLLALRAFSRFADMLAAGDTFEQRIRRQEEAMHDCFWHAQTGAFIDLVQSGRPMATRDQAADTDHPPAFSQFGNALALLAGLGTDQQRARARQTAFSEDTAADPASPYSTLFVLEALIAEKDARRALDLARRVHWFVGNPAVTTMPENFYPRDALDAGGWNIGAASSSHGWAAYGLVLPALLRGLEATAPHSAT